MLKWNKQEGRYEITKNSKFSRHDMMDKDSEKIYRFMAGFAFFTFLIAFLMLVQSC